MHQGLGLALGLAQPSLSSKGRNRRAQSGAKDRVQGVSASSAQEMALSLLPICELSTLQLP